MHNPTPLRTATALIGCLLLAGTGLEAQAQKEAIGFGVNNFGAGANECGSATTSDLNYCDDFADVFTDAFRADNWPDVSEYTNTSVDGRDWLDISKDANGADNVDLLGADFADVAMLCSHGGHVHDSDSNMSTFTMGDDDEECSADTYYDMLLGDGDAAQGDLEIAILGTCMSGHYDVWTDTTCNDGPCGGYFHVRERDGSFNTWLGFHGVSYDSNKDTNRLEDYVTASFSNGLGDNFIDEMYRNPLGANNTQCPTAVIFCETVGDCNSQFDWGGFNDRFKVQVADAKSTSKIYYVGGCDPQSGGALPN